MGLMDREYMNRTPEEREAERLVEKQHRDRLNEMATLMHKGESMTRAERKRLNQIFEENKAYMDGKSIVSSKSGKKKSGIIPIIIFMIIVLLIVAAFYFYPDLANFSI